MLDAWSNTKKGTLRSSASPSTQRIESCIDSRDLLLWSLTANIF
jgi:hypothetical protein